MSRTAVETLHRMREHDVEERGGRRIAPQGLGRFAGLQRLENRNLLWRGKIVKRLPVLLRARLTQCLQSDSIRVPVGSVRTCKLSINELDRSRVAGARNIIAWNELVADVCEQVRIGIRQELMSWSRVCPEPGNDGQRSGTSGGAHETENRKFHGSPARQNQRSFGICLPVQAAHGGCHWHAGWRTTPAGDVG